MVLRMALERKALEQHCEYAAVVCVLLRGPALVRQYAHGFGATELLQLLKKWVFVQLLPRVLVLVLVQQVLAQVLLHQRATGTLRNTTFTFTTTSSPSAACHPHYYFFTLVGSEQKYTRRMPFGQVRSLYGEGPVPPVADRENY